MSAPPQTLVLGELTSGRRLVSVPVSSCSWSVAIGAAGSIEAQIPTRATDFQRLAAQTTGLFPSPTLFPSPDLLPMQTVTRWLPSGEFRDGLAAATEPTRTFAAVMVGDRVIEAGPIWLREEDESGLLTIRATGLRSVLDHRLLLSHLVDWSTPGAVAASSLSWSGLSLGTIAKRLVQAALAHTGGSLPVVLPADEVGTHERTYPGYEMATVGQRLDELAQVQGGPEFALEPRLTADRLGVEWVLRVGTTADPTLHQAGLDWVADLTVPQGGMAGLTVTEDATSVSTRAFARGSGTDTASLISRPSSRPDLLAAGFPLLESARSYSSVVEQSTIDSHAVADREASDRPWVTWALRVEADGRLGQYRPGDWWQIRVRDRVLVEDGTHRVRMASAKGAFGDPFVSLGMVPVEVAG